MGAIQQVLMSYGGGYAANSVDYVAATPDYLSKVTDFTGNADSRTGILSAWVRLDGGNGSTLEMLGSLANTFNSFRNNANLFHFQVTDTGGVTTFVYKTVNTYTSGATWLNVLSSWDTNAGAGAKVAHLYINDTSDVTVTSDTGAAFDIDYTVATWAVGTNANALGVNSNFDGCMAELYFAPGQYLDFSSSSNRRKFISATGKPVSLGTDGSTPTGVAPILYLPGVAASVNVNAGTGGNMTINGSPATCSTSPSS